MTNRSDDLPVLVIDGARFADFDGFTREFSRLLRDHRWRGNLDAFNDVLRGGFGTPENGWVLRWLNSESSRSALGYEATTRQPGRASPHLSSITPFRPRGQARQRRPWRG